MARVGPTPASFKPGGGRKLGSKDKKPRVTAARKQAMLAESQGITPLEIMLRTARGIWDAAELLTGSEQESKRLLAASVAEKAAPYVHSKRASVQIDGDGEGGPIRLGVQIYLPSNGRD
jgi:hypothetical protein